MSERTAERSRESDTDAGTAASVSRRAKGESDDDGRTGTYFSLRALLVAFVAIGAGMTLGSLIPIIPFTTLLGIPLGAFVHGLLDRERRYVETAVAGSVLSGLAVVSSLLPQLLAGLDGVRLFAIAGGIGLVLGVVGHYFGRDLRDGLTRDID